MWTYGWRFIVLFQYNSIRWFIQMSVWSLTCQQSVFKRYHSGKFLRVLPTRWRRKPASIGMDRNYVTVTLCIPLNIFFGLVKRFYKHYINHSQTLFTLTFQSLTETFVRRSCSFLFLATVVTWRGKKSVVCVAQCIAALVPVHRTPSLLSNVHCFLNPSGTSVRLPIQDCRFWPADYMVVVACMISQSWFILFWLTG